jgi:hypothetical protein
MPRYTPQFGIAYFDLSDDLADLNNVQAETERFVIIDRQLYGFYSIFGSGVVSGWTVVPSDFTFSNNIAVDISSGLGIVGLVAAETQFDAVISDLPANKLVYIYARKTGVTSQSRSVEFFWSVSRISNPNILLLAEVTTSDSSVTVVDNSVRNEISFQALIEEEVANHRHRGTPSKIDLDLETKGILPGNKIGNLDAAKITKGVFDRERLPLIQHSDLADVGTITHEGLDTLARRIDSEEGETIGEITLINHLKQQIFLKYKFENADEELLNEILLIPGVSPSSYIDFDETTALVNVDSGCISGYPVEGVQPLSVVWQTEDALRQAVREVNTSISSSGLTIDRSDDDVLEVEGFEAASSDNHLFEEFKSSVEEGANISGVYADASLALTGEYAGKFLVDTSSNVVFSKEYASPQDWSEFNTISLMVK